MSFKIGNNDTNIFLGSTIISKIYQGSVIIYSGRVQQFQYVYKLVNLLYISNIENSIYNLDY
jgi:hypothetical protein